MLRTARAKPLGAIGAVVVLVASVLAAFGPLIAPFDPLEAHYDNLFEGPGGTFLLGTDNFGRDQLSRLIVGARPVLFVSVVSGSVTKPTSTRCPIKDSRVPTISFLFRSKIAIWRGAQAISMPPSSFVERVASLRNPYNTF